MIDQFTGRRVSCDRPCHAAKGFSPSDIGDDFPMQTGTAIVAPFAGTVRNHARPESFPYHPLFITTITADADPAVQMVFMHFSVFAPEGHYREGETIGLSGGSQYAIGAGASTGAHCHVSAIIDGIFVSYLDAFTRLASTASTAGTGAVTPISDSPVAPLPEEDTDMKFLYVDNDGNNKPVWVLLNDRTAKFVTTYDQSQANDWATVWGSAKVIARQSFLNAIDAIQKTA